MPNTSSAFPSRVGHTTRFCQTKFRGMGGAITNESKSVMRRLEMLLRRCRLAHFEYAEATLEMDCWQEKRGSGMAHEC